MATLTIRLPDEQRDRLASMAAQRGISLNRLMHDLSTRALVEYDVETRFRTRAARGSAERGLEILDALDAAHREKG